VLFVGLLMEPDNCRLSVHEFSCPLDKILVHFYVIKLKDSNFVWIGSSPAKFSNLSLALSTKYVSLARLLQQKCSLYSIGLRTHAP